MDLLLIVLALMQIIVSAIMLVFLTRLYLKTRYIPTFLLAVFFGLIIAAFLVTFPIYVISDKFTSMMLQDISLVIMIVMFPVLIMAFEGMKGRFFSHITALFIAFTTYLLGYISVIPPRWEYILQDGIWWQVTTADFDLLFSLYILSIVAIILFRLIQFIMQEGGGRSKWLPAISIIGVFAALLGGIGAYELGIPNLDYILILMGTVLVTIIYILSPNSFFLSNTNISAIMLIDSTSKMPYLTIGGHKDSNFDLTAMGLGGVMTFLQEILKAETLPTRLIHHDKGFLLEHDTKNRVTAVIVADRINDVLRQPLTYALSLFINKYSSQIADWDGEVSIFEDFKDDIRRIFKFAFSE